MSQLEARTEDLNNCLTVSGVKNQLQNGSGKFSGHFCFVETTKLYKTHVIKQALRHTKQLPFLSIVGSAR